MFYKGHGIHRLRLSRVELSRVGFDKLKSADQTNNVRSEQAEYLMEYTMEFEFVEWMSLPRFEPCSN